MKNKTAIAVTICLIIIAVFIYFVSGITSGNSVIKKYAYSGSAKEFIAHVQRFSEKDSSVIYTITDTTGTTQKDYTFYVDIELKNNKHDIVYSIACENNNYSASQTVIELVMAYDKINNIGGYNKEAQSIKLLVSIFESDFLLSLKNNNQHITISPL